MKKYKVRQSDFNKINEKYNGKIPIYEIPPIYLLASLLAMCQRT